MRIYAHLTLFQRYQISFLKNKGLSQTEIAKELQVHKSTVSRKLNRNTGGRGYLPRQPHRKIEKHLKQVWSPEQISGWLIAEKDICISHESIYSTNLQIKNLVENYINTFAAARSEKNVIERLNNRPRKTNGYKKPIQVLSKVKNVALRI